MLKGIEPKINKVGGFGVSKNPYDPALLLESV
jgi:hypothetical protein